MTAASSFATVFMRFPFASKRGLENQAIGVPGMGPSENKQQITVFAPKVTFSGMKGQSTSEFSDGACLTAPSGMATMTP
jgi:hypothetical protein